MIWIGLGIAIAGIAIGIGLGVGLESLADEVHELRSLADREIAAARPYVKRAIAMLERQKS
jgi:hypothetical protein